MTNLERLTPETKHGSKIQIWIPRMLNEVEGRVITLMSDHIETSHCRAITLLCHHTAEFKFSTTDHHARNK